MTNSWMRWAAGLSKPFSLHVEEAAFKCGKRFQDFMEIASVQDAIA